MLGKYYYLLFQHAHATPYCHATIYVTLQLRSRFMDIVLYSCVRFICQTRQMSCGPNGPIFGIFRIVRVVWDASYLP